MRLRLATKNDALGVYESLRELNQEFVKHFNAKRVKDILEKYPVGVVESENGGIMGACVVKEGYNNDALEIYAIAVNPYFKKLGVGSMLLKWAEDEAIKNDCSYIYAESYGFYNATPFYKKNGYTRFGEDIYIFVKRLEFPIGHQFTLKFA